MSTGSRSSEDARSAVPSASFSQCSPLVMHVGSRPGRGVRKSTMAGHGGRRRQAVHRRMAVGSGVNRCRWTALHQTARRDSRCGACRHPDRTCGIAAGGRAGVTEVHRREAGGIDCGRARGGEAAGHRRWRPRCQRRARWASHGGRGLRGGARRAGAGAALQFPRVRFLLAASRRNWRAIEARGGPSSARPEDCGSFRPLSIDQCEGHRSQQFASPTSKRWLLTPPPGRAGSGGAVGGLLLRCVWL